MNALGSILREFVGLFVDDGSLALIIVVWVALVGSMLALGIGPAACAVLLFLGLGAALATSVLRA